MSEPVLMTMPDGRVVGGRYFDEKSQRFVNAEGQSLEVADALPSLDEQIAKLVATRAQLVENRANTLSPEVDTRDAKIAFVKASGKEVKGNISNVDLDALVAEVKG